MDRDKRWERVKVAVDGLVSGEGEKTEDALKTVQERYEKGETDEFLKPIISGSAESRIQCESSISNLTEGNFSGMFTLIRFIAGDTLFMFNYRSDRVREIVTVLGLPDRPMEVTVPENLHITTMTRYNAEFPFPIAFPPGSMDDVLAEWLGKHGVKQCHVAGWFLVIHQTRRRG
jgi:2,3-bisphosphoglycerate-independent phosphoglycerate mutase